MTPQTYVLSKNPFLFTCLDISTGHITKRDSELLIQATAGDNPNPVSVYAFEYGWFVFVSDELRPQDLAKYGYSKEFVAIYNRARDLKCKFIQLDSDGIAYEDLPSFDW